jgi:hypothetical protein
LLSIRAMCLTKKLGKQLAQLFPTQYLLEPFKPWPKY